MAYRENYYAGQSTWRPSTCMLYGGKESHQRHGVYDAVTQHECAPKVASLPQRCIVFRPAVPRHLREPWRLAPFDILHSTCTFGSLRFIITWTDLVRAAASGSSGWLAGMYILSGLVHTNCPGHTRQTASTFSAPTCRLGI
jgi:hypothetical protein